MLKETSSDKLEKIKNIFPYICYEDLFPSPKTPLEEAVVSKEIFQIYDNFAISVHDHWLEEGELEKVINYPFFFEKVSKRNEKWVLYKEYEERFVDFYSHLYEFGCFLFYMDTYYVEIKSRKDFLLFIKQDIREMRFHRYLFPELGITVTGSFDLTHTVHASRKYFKEKRFNEIVKDTGLYILR